MIFTMPLWAFFCALVAFLLLVVETRRIGARRDEHAWRIAVLERRAGIIRPDPPGRRERWRIAAAEWAMIARRALTRRPAQGRHRSPEDTTDADKR